MGSSRHLPKFEQMFDLQAGDEQAASSRGSFFGFLGIAGGGVAVIQMGKKSFNVGGIHLGGMAFVVKEDEALARCLAQVIH